MDRFDDNARARSADGGDTRARNACRSRSASVRVGIALALTATAAACDTGDGKQLNDPAETLAPTTVAVIATDRPLDADATLPSVPIDANDTVAELPAPVGDFDVTAPWADGGRIETINTCDGLDLSPALSWTSPPEGTAQMAVALVDESVGDGTPFVHWVLAGLPSGDLSLIEGDVPLGAARGLNFFGNLGYNGPCPPPGDPDHVYRLTVYALNQQVELADGTPAADLLDFVQTVAIASAEVTGTYSR